MFHVRWVVKRVLAAIGRVVGRSGASAAGGEWRSWCADEEPGSVASLGWHFYCDRQEEEPPRGGTPVQACRFPLPTPRNPRWSGSRRCARRWRTRAPRRSSNPTPGERHRLSAPPAGDARERAAAFSDAFRRTVWATPELDYTLRRPVGALAKQVWSDERREARDAALARLGERYGLIYLGHAGCAGCKVFGPLLRAFAQRHGLDVLAVSLTGEALEGWPEAVADNGRAARLGLGNAPVPALVLFDTALRRVLPVGFGVMAEDEMAERIFALTALETGRDY